MRTELEIRVALAHLGGPENDEPFEVEGGTFVPQNAIPRDILRWVLGEPSEFGAALAEVLKQWEASDCARRN